MEMKALVFILGRVVYYSDLRQIEERAVFDWVFARRSDYARRIIDGSKRFTITLKAQDAMLISKALQIAGAGNPYEDVLIRKITSAIHRHL